MDLKSRTVFGSAPRSQQEAKEALDSLVMTWAHDIDTGQPVYIMELGSERNGSKCGCECRSCGHPLKAANAGKAEGTYVQKPHFKHSNGVVKDSCLILVARAAALRLLAEEGMIELPSRTRSASWKGLSGAEYQGAATTQAQSIRVTRSQFRDSTSAVLTLEDGKELVVRLTGTNIQPESSSEDDSDGRATIYIEIDDPRLAGLSPSELRSRLKLLPESLCWHSHWDDLALEQEATCAAMEHAQEMLDWPDGVSEQDFEDVPQELRRETLLHLTVKQILAASGQLRVPALKIKEVAGTGDSEAMAEAVLVEEQSLVLSNTRLERRIGKITPDVCADAVDAEGNSLGLLCIEVTVTNGFDQERLDRLSSANLLALEIDLSKACGRMSRSDLTKLVIDELDGKRWLHHPGIERCRQKLLEEVRVAKLKKPALIPFEHQRKFLEHVMPARGLHDQESVAKAGPRTTASALISPQDDLLRCRRTVEWHRVPEWPQDFALVDGLVSLRHDIGLGVHAGLTGIQVAHKLRCSKIDLRLHAVILIALLHFCTVGSDKEVVEDWAARTRLNLRARDPAWLTPVSVLKLVRELFPELTEKATQMIDFVQKR